MLINISKHEGKVARDVPLFINHSTCALESKGVICNVLERCKAYEMYLLKPQNVT
jgi:hypothetical protein